MLYQSGYGALTDSLKSEMARRRYDALMDIETCEMVQAESLIRSSCPLRVPYSIFLH